MDLAQGGGIALGKFVLLESKVTSKRGLSKSWICSYQGLDQRLFRLCLQMLMNCQKHEVKFLADLWIRCSQRSSLDGLSTRYSQKAVRQPRSNCMLIQDQQQMMITKKKSTFISRSLHESQAESCVKGMVNLQKLTRPGKSKFKINKAGKDRKRYEELLKEVVRKSLKLKGEQQILLPDYQRNAPFRCQSYNFIEQINPWEYRFGQQYRRTNMAKNKLVLEEVLLRKLLKPRL